MQTGHIMQEDMRLIHKHEHLSSFGLTTAWTSLRALTQRGSMDTHRASASSPEKMALHFLFHRCTYYRARRVTTRLDQTRFGLELD